MSRKANPALFAAPAHLSEASKATWAQIVPARAKSPGRLALLTVALEARDRAEQARLLIETEGLTTTTATTGAVHVNPLLKIEHDARGQFLTAWRSLSLEWDAIVDSGIEL